MSISWWYQENWYNTTAFFYYSSVRRRLKTCITMTSEASCLQAHTCFELPRHRLLDTLQTFPYRRIHHCFLSYPFLLHRAWHFQNQKYYFLQAWLTSLYLYWQLKVCCSCTNCLKIGSLFLRICIENRCFQC